MSEQGLALRPIDQAYADGVAKGRAEAAAELTSLRASQAALVEAATKAEELLRLGNGGLLANGETHKALIAAPAQSNERT